MTTTVGMETENLRLRRFTLNDIEDVYAFASDPSVTQSAGWKCHVSLSDSADIIMNVLCHAQDWAIVLKQTNQVIGYVGVSEDPIAIKQAGRMLSFVLAHAYWGMGYAYEATKAVLEHLPPAEQTALRAYHYVDNERSKALLYRLGFVYQGIQQAAIENVEHELVDVCVYERDLLVTSKADTIG